MRRLFLKIKENVKPEVRSLNKSCMRMTFFLLAVTFLLILKINMPFLEHLEKKIFFNVEKNTKSLNPQVK